MKRTTDKTRFATLSGAGKAMRTTILSVVAAALLGLGLAACERGGGDDDEPFLIGLSVFDSLSHFKEMRRAAKFAAADINAAGGNVAFEEVDIDRALFFEGKQPADSLRELVDKGVKGLVGPTTSVTSVASFRFVTDNGLVTISPSVNSDSISDLNRKESGQRYFFRTLPHNDYQAEILAKRALGKVLILHRDDEYGRDIKKHVERYLEELERPDPVSVPITIENRPGVMITDAMARQVADVVDGTSGIRNVDSIIIAAYLTDGRIIKYLRESTVVPTNVKYYMSNGLTFSEHLNQFIAGEGEDADSAEVKARLEGFTGVIAYPHSNPQKRITDFECRFGEVEESEETLHYVAYAYDAVVVMALATLAAGSTDPSRYASEVANVTKEGTKCTSYAQCAGLLTDEDASNDDIDYDGLSGPLELNGETGNVTDGYYAVYTYDGEGGRSRELVEVRNREEVPVAEAEQVSRPRRDCPSP